MGRETVGGRKRERYRGERERDTGEKEREIQGINRERYMGRKRGRDRGRERERDRGERKKTTNTKKFMEFYLLVLHSAKRSEARQWIVARQVSCYNPLSCFNPVTDREGVSERERKREEILTASIYDSIYGVEGGI